MSKECRIIDMLLATLLAAGAAAFQAWQAGAVDWVVVLAVFVAAGGFREVRGLLRRRKA